MATLGKTIRMGVAALKGRAARVDSTHREVWELIDQIDTDEFVVARTDETKRKQQELLKNSLPPSSRRSSRPSRETLMTAVSERDSKCALAPVRMQGKILFVLPKLTKKNDSRGRAGRANR